MMKKLASALSIGYVIYPTKPPLWSYFYYGKQKPIKFGYFCIFQKRPKVNNRPKGEKIAQSGHPA
jgi:hypothetical protein